MPPSVPGSNSHFLTADNAARSKTVCPLDLSTVKSSTRPFSFINTFNITMPSYPKRRAFRGYGGDVFCLYRGVASRRAGPDRGVLPCVSGRIITVVVGSEGPAGTRPVFLMKVVSAGSGGGTGLGSELAGIKICVLALSGTGGLRAEAAWVASMVFICCFLYVNAFRLFFSRAFLAIFF